MPKVYQKETVVNYIVRSTPIYEFFKLCESTPLERRVLDCGAGGEYPPLTFFLDRGYKAYGIEISKEQIDRARNFCRKNNIELNIYRADMRNDKSFSFVFAYESIFFLTKEGIVAIMAEIERVLTPNELYFVTFRSIDDCLRKYLKC